MYLKTFLLLAAVIFFVIPSGCQKEDPVDRERRELKDALAATEVLIYKGLKVGLRACPVKAISSSANANTQERRALIRNSNPDLEAEMIYLLTFDLIARATHLQDSGQKWEVADYLELATEIMALKSALQKADEDKYPTLLENIAVFANPVTSDNIVPDWYSMDYEHLLFAMIWMGTPSMPKPLGLYELSLVVPENIKEADVRLLAYLLRSVSYQSQKWPYLAEIEADGYLACLEENRDFLSGKYETPLFKTAKVKDKDASYHQLHAVGILIRALARLETDRPGAVSDLGEFVKDADAIGMQNELVWLAGTLVSIESGDNDAAENYLSLLEKSTLIGGEEKRMIKETREHLEKRDQESAFVKLSDGWYITKVSYRLATNLFKNEARFGKLNESKDGKSLIALTKSIADTQQKLSKLAPTKDLLEKGKDLLKLDM